MRILSALILTLFFNVSFGQDSTETEKTRKRPWIQLDHDKTQYAGEIGFMSLGLGYSLFKRENGELDGFLGFLPESIGGDNIVTIALKFQYLPWKKEVFKNKFQLEPLSMGVNIYHAFTKILNEQKNEDLYPNGYYWWTIGTRFGPFFGSRLTKEFKQTSFMKTLTFYYEIGTNDLFIYSWAANRSAIPIYKIWNTSFGLKATF